MRKKQTMFKALKKADKKVLLTRETSSVHERVRVASAQRSQKKTSWKVSANLQKLVIQIFYSKKEIEQNKLTKTKFLK